MVPENPSQPEAVALVRVADLQATAAALQALTEEVRALRRELAEAGQTAAQAEQQAPERLYMTIPEFAAELGVTPRTIRSRLREGMPCTHVGRYVRIPVRRARQWLEERTVRRAAAE